MRRAGSARVAGRGLGVVCALALAAGCGGPPVTPEVHPDPNLFTWSAELEGDGFGETHAWRTSGDRAWVDWAGTDLSRGTLAVVVQDGAGEEVYRAQAGAGAVPPAEATATSAPGDWTVSVSADGAAGPVRLRITAVTGQ